MSQFTTTGKLPATLDFGFQAQRSTGFAGQVRRPTCATSTPDDDYYTDTDSNAYELPTFLGNHDMGRIGDAAQGRAAPDDADLMRRVTLANSLMFLTRGQPITYYGDEQGFIGGRRRQGDRPRARTCSPPRRRATPTDPPCSVAPPGAKDRSHDTNAELYQHI